MKKTLAIVSVGIRQMLADPVYVMFLVAIPVMMTWVMSFLPVDGGMYEMAILGVLIMFVGLNIITSAGGYILDEKQHGTWDRILASTTTYGHIMAGYFIKLFTMAVMQSLILILSGKYLFGAPWNQGYLAMMVILAVYIFAMTGLGLFLAGFLKSQGQIQAVAMAVVMIGTMLGGVFVPIDNPSRVIQVISGISPQGFAVNALKDILTAGEALSAFTTPLLIMGGVGMLLLVGGVIKLQVEG